MNNNRLAEGVDPALGIFLVLVVQFLDYTTTQSPPSVPTCNVYAIKQRLNIRQQDHQRGHQYYKRKTYTSGCIFPLNLLLFVVPETSDLLQNMKQLSPENRNLLVRERSWQPVRITGERFNREEHSYRRASLGFWLKLHQF